MPITNVPATIANEQIAAAVKAFNDAEAKSHALVLKTDEDVSVAMESINLASKLTKFLVSERQARTKPLKDQAKAIEEEFAQLTTPMESLQSALNAKVVAYRAEVRRLAAEAEAKAIAERQKVLDAQRKAEEAAKKKGLPPPEVKPLPPVPVASPEPPKAYGTALGSVGFRKQWYARVDDVILLARAVVEGKVPAEVIVADVSLLTKLVRAKKGDLKYPGVTCYEEESTVNK